MKSKQSKKLKRLAEQSTVGKSVQETKALYQLLKKSYKERKGQL